MSLAETRFGSLGGKSELVRLKPISGRDIRVSLAETRIGEGIGEMVSRVRTRSIVLWKMTM